DRTPFTSSAARFFEADRRPEARPLYQAFRSMGEPALFTRYPQLKNIPTSPEALRLCWSLD
ncbi:MAG: hypothetical protein ACE5Q3_18290, partial [Alphaproteobacteria bacterium]